MKAWRFQEAGGLVTAVGQCDVDVAPAANGGSSLPSTARSSYDRMSGLPRRRLYAQT
jgi:hypothetical protein